MLSGPVSGCSILFNVFMYHFHIQDLVFRARNWFVFCALNPTVRIAEDPVRFIHKLIMN